MSRITQFFIAVVLMVVLVQSSLAQNGANRTGGYGRLVLDDGNDGGTLERVYLSNSNGSLGIDANGGVTGSFPSTCALVDMASVTKGVLLPRMTTAQRDLICPGTTPEGLMVYNLTTHTLDIYGGGGWGAISGWTLVGNTLPALGGGGTGPVRNPDRGWTIIGNVSVDGRRDLDTITIGKQAGKFRQLVLMVDGSDAVLQNVVVTFGNGEKFSPPTKMIFKQGQRTGAIDLPGETRFINTITFRAGNLPGGGKANIIVFAK